MIDILCILWAGGLFVMLILGDLARTNFFDKFSVKFDQWIDVYMLTFATGTVLLAIGGISYWLCEVK